MLSNMLNITFSTDLTTQHTGFAGTSDVSIAVGAIAGRHVEGGESASE